MSNRSKSKPVRRMRRGRASGLVKSNPSLQIGQGQFVPKLTRVSLRFSATSAVKFASIDKEYVSGNNVRDPLGSSGSGAPPGFTYWASMYERYRVLGSRFEVSFRYSSDLKDTSTVGASGRVIVYPTNNNTTLATGSDDSAQPYAKTQSYVTQRPGRIVSTMKSATILGQKDALGADRLQSQVTTQPNDEWFWACVAVNDNDVSTNTEVWRTYTATYDVEFFDRQPIDRSAITRHFDAAYLENCKFILEKEAKKAQYQAEQKRSFDKLLGKPPVVVDTDTDYVKLPPTPLPSRLGNDDVKKSVDSQFSKPRLLQQTK